MSRKSKPQPDIGIENDANTEAASAIDSEFGAVPQPPRTKAGHLRERLGAPGGSSLSELMELTGWQAHTIRAALTGLRKTGLAITRRREAKETFYKAEGGATTEGPAAVNAAAMAGPEVVDTTEPPMATAAVEAPTSSAPANNAGEVVA